MLLFQNGKIQVRKLAEKDKPLLTKWLSDSAVLKFYEGRDYPFDIDKVNRNFYGDENHVFRCIVLFEGKEIGYIQFYLIEEELKATYGYSEGNIFGIDQFIGETGYWNQGIGTLLVKSMVNFLIEDRKADYVVMDPQAKNGRALRCYEKCGFHKVKWLPKHELHEGEYQDCWLMEYKK
ncbi:aminoglycoside 6'-N-acetyltransferase [Salinibacillus kushneri]|uniref:Aminoglycoside 6'-N-acetyltransferase n=1 Tax=Salinibacillus kushneri TaxID=237682 RepID=A0A1I0F3U8_9BACI|nr:GNAT family N-acetyltransferase [Salinibacillus kushneri]SET52070.1 aminoglycoside 6'-N-acetyltransferase [Salinibacillus kushneri]